MEAIKLTWYQLFFNKQFGYRKDYKASFWYYINQYVKRYIINITYRHDGKPEAYSVREEVKGPRGGRTNNYRTVTKPASKATYRDLSITFFGWTWFSITFEFKWSGYIFPEYGFSFSIDKLKWTFDFSFKNH
tara:strand:+ start:37 stop:432 length:396 start_codon:yes stop_codon:yes gene_type:complete